MPYKAFGGETLTASDVNTHLMRQSVIRVPNAAGLAAIPGPEVNMVAARDDDPGGLYVWNGTTWRAFRSGPFAQASGMGSITMTGVTTTFNLALPAGRFTQPPFVFMTTRSGSYGVSWSVVATSTTSATCTGFNGASGLSIPYQWHALQMQSDSAVG